jgi:putative component of membrane protein insertase Oxa1/YidC/SpoIIIJ protein YidD
MRNIGVFTASVLIDVYRICVSPFLSVFVGGGCKRSPTCSVYTKQAISKHGLQKGILMGAKRVFLCNNFL